MNSEILRFTYFDGTILQGFIGEDGEPWFYASDVCQILELGNIAQAVSRLEEDERGIIIGDTLGGPQSLTTVSEAGLYTLALRSRKPEAKAFRRWVTHEVLPAIRRTGRYSLAPEPEPEIEPKSINVKFLAGQLQGAVEIAKICGLDGNQAILCGIKGLRSITGFDVALHFPLSLPSPENEKIKTPTQLGQSLGLTAQKINARLCELGYQVKPHGEWELTEAGKAFGVYLDVGKQHSNGTPIQQIKWRESVLDKLRADAGLFALID